MEQRPIFGYIRVSTEDQKKGHGPARQEQGIHDYCAKNKLGHPQILKDIGVSAFKGFNTEKGELGKFLLAVDEGEIENPILIVESLDRISRQSVKRACSQLLAWTDAGIEIHTAIDGKSYSEDMDMMDIMYALVTQERSNSESELKSQRLKDSWIKKRAAAIAHKKPMTKRCPQWITIEDGKFVLIPERVKVIRQIFAWTIKGKGATVIARLLNEQGTPTWGAGKRAGMQWWNSYVKKIIYSPTIYGEIKTKDEVIKNYYPVVVSRKTVLQAQKVTKSRSQQRVRSTIAYPKAIGLKIFYDGGRAVYVCKGRKEEEEHPRAYYIRRRKTGKSDYFEYSRLESTIHGALTKYDPDADPKYDLFKKATPKAKAVSAKLTKVKMQISNLLTIAEGEPSKSIKSRITQLEKEQERLENEESALLKKDYVHSASEKIVRKNLKLLKPVYPINHIEQRINWGEVASPIIESTTIQDNRLLIKLINGHMLRADYPFE